MSSIEHFDRLLAGQFGTAPLMNMSSAAPSTDGTDGDDTPLRTPSLTGSIPIESAYNNNNNNKASNINGEERTLKLQQLYRALADLYVDPEQIPMPMPYDARSSMSASASMSASSPPSGPASPGSPASPASSASPAAPAKHQPQQQQQQETRVPAITPPRLSAAPAPAPETPSIIPISSSSSSIRHSAASSMWDLQPPQQQQPTDIIEEEEQQEMMLEPRMLNLDDIYFTKTSLPERQKDDGRNVLARHFPQLTEPPARMFGEDGSPLPPTKKEETTAEEREVRKRALVLRYRGKKIHSLIKSMVVMESRSIQWRRVGDDENNYGVTPLPPLPDVWALDIVHQDLDNLQKQKAKRVFELADSRCGGKCIACHGSKVSVCSTCKGTAADECWWCNGSGKQKGSTCRRCLGQGKLACQACNGSLKSPCQPCKGQGSGLYAAMVQVRVRRVDFPPLPTSSLAVQSRDADAIRVAATKRTKQLIERLTTASNAKSKNHHAPLTASCTWETSASHLVEVEVPLAAKLRKRRSFVSLSRKSSSNSLSSSTGGASSPVPSLADELVGGGLLSRKVPTSLRYFLLPSDPDLQPAELAKADFERALASSSPKLEQQQYGPDGQLLSPPVSPSGSSSGSMTPVLAAFRPHVSPLAQMALTPDGGMSRPASRFHSPIASPALRPSTPSDIIERDSYFGSHIKKQQQRSSSSHARSASAGRFPIFSQYTSNSNIIPTSASSTAASQASTPRA